MKIADFGLSERDYNLPGSRTAKSESARQPIAWLAYEVLRNKDKVYASDVWSYGVYMWEVFEFGYGNPYAHMREQGAIEVHKLLKFLEEGNRLAMPELCPDLVFEVMKQCWELDPTQRPSFGDLKEKLETLAYKIDLREVYPIRHQSSQFSRDQLETEYSSVSSPRSSGTQDTHISYAALEEFEMQEKETNPDSTLPIIFVHSLPSQSREIHPPTSLQTKNLKNPGPRHLFPISEEL